MSEQSNQPKQETGSTNREPMDGMQRETIRHIKTTALLKRQEADEILKCIERAGDNELNQILALLECLAINGKYAGLIEQERTFMQSKIRTLQGIKPN